MVQSNAAVRDADQRGETVDLGQLWSALVTNWRWIVVPAVLACLASIVYVTFATPRFSGEAKVLLESRESIYTRPVQDRDLQSQQIDEQAVASQVQVVTSRDVAREAIKRLDLVGNPEFDPLVGPMNPLTRIRAMIGAGSAPNAAAEERIFKAYYERLLVFPINRSRVVAVEFQSRDPDLAARGANVVAQVYLETLEAAKKDTARSASAWLGTNIAMLRDRVTESEAAVEEFRARTGLLMGANNATITSQQLADFTAQLAQAQALRGESEAKAGLIRELIQAGRAFDIPDVANNELIRRLTEQRIALHSQLALELRTLLPGHPRIKELEAQLRGLDGQIRGAAERTVRTLENDARIAGVRVDALQAALELQKSVAAKANESEVQLRALEREAKAQRDQLEAYLARYRDATARDSENAAPPDARIVSRAVVPQAPVFPKKGPIVVLATLATALFAAGVIVARQVVFGMGSSAASRAPVAPVTAAAGEARAAPGEPAGDAEPAPANGQAPAPIARLAALRPHVGLWQVPSYQAPAISAPAVAPAFGPPVPLALREGPGLKIATDDSPAQSPPSVETGPDTPASEAAPGAVSEPDPALGETLDEAASQEPGGVQPAAEEEIAEDPQANGPYEFGSLIARLSRNEPEDRGRRVLVTGCGGHERAVTLARGLASVLVRRQRALVVMLDPGEENAGEEDRAGFTDLVTGEASFFEVIEREQESGLHMVGSGGYDVDLLAREWEALEITIAAFDQTYDWTLFVLRDGQGAALDFFAERTDCVVIASDRDPTSPPLVALYDAAKCAGAPDVVVACERAGANAVAA